MTTSSRQTLAIVVSALSVTLLWCSLGRAQETVTIKPEQQRLAKKAVKAIKAERFDEAVTLSKKAHELGENNVTWLNLGRAYFYAGRCADAVAAYDSVEGAPRVAAPTPQKVSSMLSEYRAELEKTCPGTIRVVCSELPGLTVQIDGNDVACDSAAELPAGTHTVVARLGSESYETKIQLVGTKEVSVQPTFDSLALTLAAQGALTANDFEDAEKLLDAALANGGDYNLTFLVQGRLRFRAGDCRGAATALRKVPDAKMAPETSAGDVLVLLDEYKKEIGAECPGWVTVTCEPGDVQIIVDGGQPESCTDSSTANASRTLALPPGRHTIEAFYQGARDEAVVEIAALDEESVTFTMETPAPLDTWGIVLGATGVVLIGVGAAVDRLVLSPTFDDYEAAGNRGDRAEFDSLRGDIDTQRLAIFGLYGAGAALVATGAVLWILAPSETMPETSGLRLHVGPDDLAATWRITF